MKPDGTLLGDPPADVIRERKRDAYGIEWERPGGQRHFKRMTRPALYHDGNGWRRRRLKWTDEGNGVIACRSDARIVRVDTDDLRWRMRHRDGSSLIKINLTHIDNVLIGTLPAVNYVIVPPNIVRVPNIATDTNWRITITDGPVVETVRLRSDQAPRDFTWRLKGVDIANRFRSEYENDAFYNHEYCRENILQNVNRPPAQEPFRWLEIDDFGGPQISVAPDGEDVITIRKRWTGRVSNIDPVTRIPAWETLPVSYPVEMG